MEIIKFIISGVFIALWSICLGLSISTFINVIRDK